PFERGALSHGRRLRGRAYSLSRRRRGDHRGPSGTGRLLFLSAWYGAAATARGQAPGACGEQPEASGAVARSAERRRAIPNSDYAFWIGVFMPAKTPRDIVDQFHRAAIETMQLPNVKERLATLGMDPMPLTPAEFDDQVRAEIASTGLLAKAAGGGANQ